MQSEVRDLSEDGGNVQEDETVYLMRDNTQVEKGKITRADRGLGR